MQFDSLTSQLRNEFDESKLSNQEKLIANLAP